MNGSPQIENGFVKLAIELYEAFCKIRIPGEARQVLDTIIRKTYGWHKKEDYISLSQFCDATGIARPHIIRAIELLLKMNLIITQKGNAFGNIYYINKKYQTWKALPKKVTLPKKVMTVALEGNLPLPKKVHTKDNLPKDTITKERDANPLLFLLNVWKDRNPLTVKASPKMITHAEAAISAALTKGLPYQQIETIIWDTAGQAVEPWKLFDDKRLQEIKTKKEAQEREQHYRNIEEGRREIERITAGLSPKI